MLCAEVSQRLLLYQIVETDIFRTFVCIVAGPNDALQAQLFLQFETETIEDISHVQEQPPSPAAVQVPGRVVRCF